MKRSDRELLEPATSFPARRTFTMPFLPIGEYLDDDGDHAWAIGRRERILAPPEVVWRALTEPAELVRWWCDEAEVDLQPGGRLHFRGATVPGGEVEGEIVELEAPRSLVYRWTLDGASTTVRFALENQLEQTHLLVRQTCDRKLDWSDDRQTPNWWWLALPVLRSLVESGDAPLRFDYEAARQPQDLRFEVDVFTFPWVIWSKLTQPAELARWWRRDATLELADDGAFEAGTPHFQEPGKGPQRVLHVVENEILEHDWHWEAGEPSRVQWSISESERATRVTLTAQTPREPEVPPSRLALDWAVKLLYLKQLSERGVTPLEYQA